MKLHVCISCNEANIKTTYKFKHFWYLPYFSISIFQHCLDIQMIHSLHYMCPQKRPRALKSSDRAFVFPCNNLAIFHLQQQEYSCYKMTVVQSCQKTPVSSSSTLRKNEIYKHIQVNDQLKEN